MLVDVPSGAGVVKLDVLVIAVVVLLLLLDVYVDARQGIPSSFLHSADILAAFIPLFVGSQTAFTSAEIRPETQFAVTQGVD